MDAVTEKVVRLREIDGVIYASSRTIADDFGKRHDNVLRDIQAVIQTLPPDLGTRWFRADRYYEQASNRKGRALSCFDLTRDGWVQVVRRWTNSKANAWFLAYQLKFNEMEGKLGAGAKTEALFDRNKRDNVVSFEGPPKAQAELKLGHAELGRQARAGTLSANAATIATWQHPLPKLRLHHISIVVVALGIRDKAGAATSRTLAFVVGALVDNAGPFAIRAGLHGQASVFFAAGCPMSPRRCKAILGLIWHTVPPLYACCATNSRFARTDCCGIIAGTKSTEIPPWSRPPPKMTTSSSLTSRALPRASRMRQL